MYFMYDVFAYYVVIFYKILIHTKTILFIYLFVYFTLMSDARDYSSESVAVLKLEHQELGNECRDL